MPMEKQSATVRLGEVLYDLEARIEGIFPLSIGDMDGPPEWLEELTEDSDCASRHVFASIPALTKFSEYPSVEDVAGELVGQGIEGFVCKISWCPRNYRSPEIYMSGWGLTRCIWVYGETVDVAISRAIAAVEKDHDKTKAAALSRATSPAE